MRFVRFMQAESSIEYLSPLARPAKESDLYSRPELIFRRRGLTVTCISTPKRPRRRGITLAESLFATALLAMAVAAVFSAIGSGASHADESAQRIAATIAGEDLLAKTLLKRGSDLDDWNGRQENHGYLTDLSGRLIAKPQQRVSRSVWIEPEVRSLPGFETIDGRVVRVDTFDKDGQFIGSIMEWVADSEYAP